MAVALDSVAHGVDLQEVSLCITSSFGCSLLRAVGELLEFIHDSVDLLHSLVQTFNVVIEPPAELSELLLTLSLRAALYLSYHLSTHARR